MTTAFCKISIAHRKEVSLRAVQNGWAWKDKEHAQLCKPVQQDKFILAVRLFIHQNLSGLIHIVAKDGNGCRCTMDDKIL